MPQANTAIGTATILSGASLSNSVDLRSRRLLGLVAPAGWTAAAMTFQGSVDGATYADVYDEANAEVLIAAIGANRIFMFSEALRSKLDGLALIKFRSGTAAAPVPQGADRVFTVIALSAQET